MKRAGRFAESGVYEPAPEKPIRRVGHIIMHDDGEYVSVDGIYYRVVAGRQENKVTVVETPQEILVATGDHHVSLAMGGGFGTV